MLSSDPSNIPFLVKTSYNVYNVRPPTFKQSTPSCRTNVRQLLWREQCMERERRTEAGEEDTAGHSEAKQIPRERQDQPARIQDIPTEVYKVLQKH